MKLEQIKNEVAKELNPKMQASIPDVLKQFVLDKFVDTVAKRYATACVKASQEKIYGNVRYLSGLKVPAVDKQSIVNPDNIVLL